MGGEPAVPLLPLLGAATGLLGLAVVLALSPRRRSTASLTLGLAFACLLVGGFLGVPESPLEDPQWGSRLASGGCLALGAGALLALRELRKTERRFRAAAADADTVRREMDRVNGTNVRLEDELQDLRRRVPATAPSPSARAAPGETEAAVERLRERYDAHSKLVERRQRAMFLDAVEGMAMLENETLRLVEVNPALERLADRDQEALAALSLIDLFEKGDDQPGRSDLQSAAREGRALPVPLLRPDGTRVHVEVTVTAIGTPQGPRLFAVVRDVSHRHESELDALRVAETERARVRELEAELAAECGRREAAEEACRRERELGETKDHFLATVSHELRTPLTSIRSFSEILLQHDDAASAERVEFLGIINKESERLTRLVNDVLDLARIEAGESRLAMGEFDLRDAARDAVASVRGMAMQCGVEVAEDVGDRPWRCHADRDRMQQLFTNLIANAVKFSDRGDRVDVRLLPGRDGWVRVDVEDRGIGIPEGALEQVFVKFHRIDDRDDDRARGSGLGLAICREIVQLHGGRIWAESRVGEGSVFHVDLPLADEARRSAARRAERVDPRAEPAEVLPLEAPAEPRAARSAARTPSSASPLPPLRG